MKIRRRSVLVTLVVFTGVAAAEHAHAQGPKIGINVVLNMPVNPIVLAGLGTHGQVLDVIPEIKAVTLRAYEGELAAIQALPYVGAANPDVECTTTGMTGTLPSGFASGGNTWNLDAINVTDFGMGRTVAYDGEGVYIAVIDIGLPFNWREYFPEERIDAVHARAFGGGGGTQGTVSVLPGVWEHDTFGHGTWVTSVLLGFRYHGPEPYLPATFEGVAPKATVIPVRVGDNFARWFSQVARAFVYVANLKATGELGDAPLVISMSMGGFRDDAVMAAAIDYAIASGVIVVVAAGNEANAGMRFPARYPPVISAAATGWVDQFPPDDPTLLEFCVRDVGEGDVSRHLIAPFSAWELPGQDLDVAAPGLPVPVACTRDGRVDYTFFVGTSAACPHVSGVAALMLQKNPNLTQPQVEAILEGSAMPLPPGCRSYVLPAVGPGNPQPTWSDHRNVSVFGFASCWGANAASHGLLQADAALTATPLP